MKVIFTLDSLGNAGTEKSMLDIISHFSPAIQANVVYFYADETLKPAYEKAGIPLISLNLTGKTSWKQGIKELKKIIKEEKADLVVSSILRANIISRIACKQTGTPLIGTFVSDSYSKIRTKSFSLKRQLGFYQFYLLDRFTSSIPKVWISNSKCIKESNCRKLGVPEKKVTVIYRGRNLELFREKTNNASPQPFRFVYVARLLQTKGLAELVEAFQEVRKTYPEIILDVYGEGTYRRQLEAFVENNGLAKHLHIHGRVPEGWQKLYEADCFVFPSWYEGFSGSLVEAMMVGIPIIASDIPMNLEAVNPGKTALVHKVKDAADLAIQMKKAISDYPKMITMAKAARAEAAERFDIKVIARQYEDFLIQALSEES